MNSNSRPIDKRGFTLLEVMIALFILVLIGTTVSKAVVDAARLKEMLKDETDFASEFRTSTSFIERDLSQIFNPRWFLPADLKPIDPYMAPPPPVKGLPPGLTPDEINRRTRGTAFETFPFWGPILDSSGIRGSRFIGKENEMSFVTASHVRIYQMKKESIYAKVKYLLVPHESDPNLSKEQNDKLRGLFSLVKIENTRAFETQEPKEAPYINTYTILTRIKKLRFQYLKGDEKEPFREWDSQATEPKGEFPNAVEMEVSIVGPEDRVLESKIFFNLETPNDVLPKTY
jgi:prepilin-type N-terminal cleavage/methylation domain-containing protein